MKTCTKCKENKNLSDFYKCKTQKDGLNFWCKTCMKRHFLENKSKKSEYDEKRYKEKEEKIKTNVREWKSQNKEKVLVYNRAYIGVRNARVKQTTPPWLSLDQRREIIEIYKNRPEGYHVDHIVPIHGKNLCGLHVPWNLQYLPAIENMKKGNK